MRWTFSSLLACVFTAAIANAAPVSSLEVAPTTLDITSGQPGLLYVANRSAAPMTVQIDVYDWKQSANIDHLVLSNSAFVSPPLTTIAPGERQIIRILAEPTAMHGETAYRLRVSELPDPSVRTDGVQVLVQFSIPVFVHGSGEKADVAWNVAARGGDLDVTAQNNGDRVLKLAGLKLSSDGDAPIAIAPDRVAYILPGASHVWSVDAPRALPVRVHIAATEERSGNPLTADVAIAR